MTVVKERIVTKKEAEFKIRLRKSLPTIREIRVLIKVIRSDIRGGIESKIGFASCSSPSGSP